MNEIKVINKSMLLGKEIDVYGSVDEPLFLAKDVAEWIEHTQPSKMVETVDEDEKLMGTIFLSGQNREVWMLTENGLYEVLMQSRKPIAKQFKKGVKEILKTIRKTGSYSTANNVDAFDRKLKAASWVADFLNMSAVSKLILAKSITSEFNLPLPDYVPSEGVVHSAAYLLKKYNVGKSSIAFNKEMVKYGYLREEQRPTKNGKPSKFKVITNKGLAFGRNDINDKNLNETQPRRYDDKFEELLSLVGLSKQQTIDLK